MKTWLGVALATLLALGWTALAEESPSAAEKPQAVINGEGPGWRALTLDDFVNVNCDQDTWSMQDGKICATGKPVGVVRSTKEVANFELVTEWRHLKPAGNSGIFVWTQPASLEGLKPNALPKGIEVQVLDNGYATQYEERTKKKSDWFTTHGDVFPVGSKMTPFPPLSADKSRSFPTQNRSKSSPEWNHYYVRAINGEVRLWVNGVEVSGGSNCEPRTGFLCLESEGSPVEYRNMKIRELP